MCVCMRACACVCACVCVSSFLGLYSKKCIQCTALRTTELTQIMRQKEREAEIETEGDREKGRASERESFTFTFRAFSRRFYPKPLTISTFVRRKK